MARFHIGTSGPAPCRAKTRPCPLGEDTLHFPNRKEALDFYQRDLERTLPALSTVTKNPPSPRGGAPASEGPERTPAEGSPPRLLKAHVDISRIRGRVPGPYYAYHKSMGFPKGFPLRELQALEVKLLWSKHAKEEALKDSLGPLELRGELSTKGWEVVELKFNKTDGKLNRALFRSPPDPQGRVACLVLAPDLRSAGHWHVITAWHNRAKDRHKTLDKRRYDYPR